MNQTCSMRVNFILVSFMINLVTMVTNLVTTVTNLVTITTQLLQYNYDISVTCGLSLSSYKWIKKAHTLNIFMCTSYVHVCLALSASEKSVWVAID